MSTAQTLDTVLERVAKPRRSGSGYTACCPAHEDHRPSLSISEGEEGRVLLKCQRGCTTEAIVEALGLTMADLFNKRENGHSRRSEIVATYDYTDESGELLFQVVRKSDKTFPQRRPDGHGGWIWKLEDTRRVLYHLPQVLEAVRERRRVFIVEGEKDVHSLEPLGLVATTNPGGASEGASKWKPEYTDTLRGAHVVILPDNDETGRKHVRQVASALSEVAAEVKVLDLPGLPEKGDVTDWIGAGGTAEELKRLVLEAPDAQTCLSEADSSIDLSEAVDQAEKADVFIDWSVFWERDRTQADWIYEDLLARGRGHALYAAHKGGKSLLMLYIAAQLATGPERIVVIYLDYEMGEDDIYERLEDMGYGPGSDLSRLRYALLPSLPPLDTAAGARALTGLTDQVQKEWPEHHLVVILDTMGRAVAGEENSSDTFRQFYAHTGIELKRRGVTYARLDHGGKDASKGQRGSSGKGDDVDIVWKLTKTESGIRLDLDVARMHWVPKRVTFGMMEDPLRYVRVDSAYPVGTTDTAELLDSLEVPLEASVRTAQDALRDAGEGRRGKVIQAALRWRRERLEGAS